MKQVTIDSNPTMCDGSIRQQCPGLPSSRLEAFWRFVDENTDADPSRLRLKYHRNATLSIDVASAILQIECRQRFRKKLGDTLSAFPHFLFPSVLAGEQSTSDLLAQFHSGLVAPGCSVVDLTAGLGIDLWHFADWGCRVEGVEIDRERFTALDANFGGINSVNLSNADCRDFIDGYTGNRFDVAFIDPSRRTQDGHRAYALSDCTPDVVALLPAIERIAHTLVVKMSPMLDIVMTLRMLPQSRRIIALGTPTECKELIAVVDFDAPLGAPTLIEAVTLVPGHSYTFSFNFADEGAAEPRYGIPREGDILCDLYPSVMKAAPFKTLCQRSPLTALGSASHLYFVRDSESGVLEATTRVGHLLRIEDVVEFTSSEIRRLRRSLKSASITCRNFDIQPDALRRQLKLADGGSLRIFATKDVSGKPMLILANPM